MVDRAKVINFPHDKNQKTETFESITGKGFLRISNIVAAELCSTRLSDRESRLLFTVMFKTFGFNKLFDWICNEHLAELTEIGINHISETKSRLFDRKILVKNGIKIGVNIDVSQWEKIPPKNTKNPKSGKKQKPEIGCAKTRNRVLKTPKSGAEKPETGVHNKQDKTILQKTIVRSVYWKQFFELYPSNKKGGNDATAWSKFKALKLTDDDAKNMFDWLVKKQAVDGNYKTEPTQPFALGITKFISESIWKTPIKNCFTDVKNSAETIVDADSEIPDTLPGM